MYANDGAHKNMLLDIISEQREEIRYLRGENARLRQELKEAQDAKP